MTVRPTACRVTILGSYLGRRCDNVFACFYSVDDSVTNLQTALTAVLGNSVSSWKTNVLPMVSAAYTMSGGTAYDVFNPQYGSSVGNAGTGGVSLATSDPLSAALCAKVQLITGLRGRSYAGRTGIAGIQEQQVVGNTWVTGSLSTFTTGMNYWRTGIASPSITGVSGLTLAVLSTITAGAPRPIPLVTPVTSLAVSSTVGTRVSRLR